MGTVEGFTISTEALIAGLAASVAWMIMFFSFAGCVGDKLDRYKAMIKQQSEHKHIIQKKLNTYAFIREKHPEWKKFTHHEWDFVPYESEEGLLTAKAGYESLEEEGKTFGDNE